MKKKHIEQLLAQGAIQTAIVELRNCALNADDRAVLNTLEHNFSQAKQQFAAQQIPFKEFEKTSTLVASGLAQILGNLPDETPTWFARNRILIAVSGIVLSIVLVITLVLAVSNKEKPPQDADHMSTQGTQSPVIKGDNTHLEYNNTDKKDE